MLLQMGYIFTASTKDFNVYTANKHRELNFCHQFYSFIYKSGNAFDCSIGYPILMLVSQILNCSVNCLVIDQLKSSFFKCSYSKLIKKIFGTGPNHGGGPSVPLQYTVDMCTVMLKYTLGENWLKLISGNYNVCQAMCSFIKKVKHVVIHHQV